MNVETTYTYSIKTCEHYRHEVSLSMDGVVFIAYKETEPSECNETMSFSVEEAEAIAEAILALAREARRCP